MHWTTLTTWCALFVRVAVAISSVTSEGTGFLVDGKQFFIIGVDYQPGGSTDLNQGFDPLSDLSNCQRDVYLMQQLGVNTIRTYAVNHTLNHDACMSLLAAAGIYVVLDVNAPGWMYSVNIQEPWTSYDIGYMTNVLSVVDEFSAYPNLLGFIAGNELANDADDATLTAPYIRAIQRDIRQYIGLHVNRNIPVGYSATDQIDIRADLAYYLDCSDDDNGQSDFYGLNSYEWCGNATFQSSGYATLVEIFSNLTMPVFLSEFGCNKVLPRTFGDVGALYTSDMNSVFSGGLVYEYDQAINNYGLVNVDSSDDATILPDYDALYGVYKEISLPSTPTYTNKTRPACSNVTPAITGFVATNTVPVQPPGVSNLISAGVTNVTRGSLIDVDLSLKSVTWTITDAAGNVVTNPTISTVSGWNVVATGAAVTSTGSSSLAITSQATSASASASSSLGTSSGTSSSAAATTTTSKSSGVATMPSKNAYAILACAGLSLWIM